MPTISRPKLPKGYVDHSNAQVPQPTGVFAYSFASIYPMYVQKVEKKGRSSTN